VTGKEGEVRTGASTFSFLQVAGGVELLFQETQSLSLGLGEALPAQGRNSTRIGVQIHYHQFNTNNICSSGSMHGPGNPPLSLSSDEPVAFVDGAKQPVHWFFRGKGLGVQQGTSVWVGLGLILHLRRAGWSRSRLLRRLLYYYQSR
jgi:hypothetical protein